MTRNLWSVKKKNSNFSQPISPSKSIFQPIWAIFRGHHTLHRMHWTQTHSTIQHPNLYSLTIMQHNQRNTPVIMHPNNVFILWHLKMIPIFIWPCSTKIPLVLLCHIESSQTWYLSGANHILHHKSFKYHTEIVFKPFWFALTCSRTHLKKIPFFHIFYIRPHGSPG